VLNLRVVLVELIARLGLPSSLSAQAARERREDQDHVRQPGRCAAGRGERAEGPGHRCAGAAVRAPRPRRVPLPRAAPAHALGRRRWSSSRSARSCSSSAGSSAMASSTASSRRTPSSPRCRPCTTSARACSSRSARPRSSSASPSSSAHGSPAARGLRRPSAAGRPPRLRDQPSLAYWVIGTLLVLVFAWGPIPATRTLIPSLILIALALLGTEGTAPSDRRGVPARRRARDHTGQRPADRRAPKGERVMRAAALAPALAKISCG